MSTATLIRPRAGRETNPVSPAATTEAEYFRRENSAGERSEFRYGQVVPMAGVTEDHGTIISNIVVSLKSQLRGKGCRVLSSDQRIRAGGQLYYPDVVATCGDRIFDAFDPTTLLSPTVIAEVLSDSTEHIDRGEKLRNYCSIASLRTYLLVSQHNAQVEQYERNERGQWVFASYADKKDRIELSAIGCFCPLVDLYEDINVWEQDADPEPEAVPSETASES